MDLKKCQIFTPQDTVKYMLDQIEYHDNIFNKKIIDNSCGTGNFLVEIARRFILDGISQQKSKITIKKSLQQCVVGFEVDKKLFDECRCNLNLVANEFGIKNVDWNIINGDGLYVKEEEQYDYVVGNPPYIAYTDLDEETRKSTKDNFISCSLGKYDYSYAFIEKGLNLLKDGGKMVMITPSNMFKTVFGENIRSIIREDITCIIDCASLKIFGKVLTAPAITLYQKNGHSSIVIYREIKNIVEKIIEKNKLIGKWNFTEYIECGQKRFGDYFKVSNSIATLANKVFIHTLNDKGDIDIDIEKEILRTAKSPKTEQFGISQKIIFPYDYKGNELLRYSESEMKNKFPKTMKYLASKRDILDNRDSDKSACWYEYGRSQAIRHLNCEKLLLSTIVTKKVRVYYLDKTTIPYSGLYIIPKNQESLSNAELILKTERFYQYLVSKGVKVSGDSIRISSKDIEDYKY